MICKKCKKEKATGYYKKIPVCTKCFEKSVYHAKHNPKNNRGVWFKSLIEIQNKNNKLTTK